MGVDLALCMGPPPQPFSQVVAQRPPPLGGFPAAPCPLGLSGQRLGEVLLAPRWVLVLISTWEAHGQEL